MDARAGTSASSGRLGRRRLAGSQSCCPQTGRLWGVGGVGLRPCESGSGVAPAAGREGLAGLSVLGCRWPRFWFRQDALVAPRTPSLLASTDVLWAGLRWLGVGRFSVRHPGLDHPDLGRPAGADYSFLALQPYPHPLHRRRRPQSANAVSINLSTTPRCPGSVAAWRSRRLLRSSCSTGDPLSTTS